MILSYSIYPRSYVSRVFILHKLCLSVNYKYINNNYSINNYTIFNSLVEKSNS